MKMHIWVFSYNRGVFLRNCVESIEQCAPMCQLTVFDDNSTDVETQAILADIAKKHRVMKPETGGQESKHGGLYANMQRAFEGTPDDELIYFVQDDMQLVRPVTDKDLQLLSGHFGQNPRAAFVNPNFLKGCNRKSDEKLTRFDPATNMYFVDRMHRSAGAFYADASVACVARLRAVSWKFHKKESLNEKQARQHFSQMPYLRNPISAFLPNVSAYRGKVRSWAMRRADTLTRSGFYPVEIMSVDQSYRFVARDPSIIPYAEDFLHLSNGQVPKPWIYYPLQGRKWLKKANSMELWLKKKIPL